MGTMTIDGKVYTGKSLSIVDGVIIVDGVVQGEAVGVGTRTSSVIGVEDSTDDKNEIRSAVGSLISTVSFLLFIGGVAAICYLWEKGGL